MFHENYQATLDSWLWVYETNHRLWWQNLFKQLQNWVEVDQIFDWSWTARYPHCPEIQYPEFIQISNLGRKKRVSLLINKSYISLRANSTHIFFTVLFHTIFVIQEFTASLNIRCLKIYTHYKYNCIFFWQWCSKCSCYRHNSLIRFSFLLISLFIRLMYLISLP